MQDRDLINGFSDLKGMLIQTYKIDRDRALVKLYFTEFEGELIMHDYNDHFRSITICLNIAKKIIPISLSPKATLVVLSATSLTHPAKFLNEGFKLYGFFRS